MRENMKQYLKTNAGEQWAPDLRSKLAPGMGIGLAPDIRSRLAPGMRSRLVPGMRSGGRTIIAAVLSVVMALSMTMCPAFAAGDTPDESSYAVQQAAGPQGSTATVTLGKILTSAKPDSFPGVTDFVFLIEPVEGWMNTNVNTGGSGTAVAAEDLPRPDAVSTAHQSVTYTSAGTKVLVGDFQNEAASNHSAGEGADTSTKRTRTTPVHITFAKAGYYVYRVKETGSLPGAEGAREVPVRNTPGVEYDDNEYFMVFYVCNKIDAQGNTLDDVYVHSITSYTNESGSDTYKPDLTDIQNVTDNGGNAAGENTGEAGTGRPVSHNLGKVGVSDPETPNQLEAYRMWSAFVTQDVVLKKNVTGNLGDRDKYFEFTVTLSGLGSNTTYVTNEMAETGEASTREIISVTSGTKLGGSSFRSNASGEAVLTVKLMDDDIFVLDDLPLRAQYTVCEAASDHVAKYAVTSSNNETGAQGAVIASAAGTNDNISNQELTTGTETVDRGDGTVTILFTNNRDLATITGVPGLSYTIYAGIALLLAAAAAAIIRRRKLYAGDDLFEE